MWLTLASHGFTPWFGLHGDNTSAIVKINPHPNKDELTSTWEMGCRRGGRLGKGEGMK